MTRRPTRRALGLAGLGALLVGVGATAQAGWLFVLAAGVLGALIVSAPLCPRLDRCTVRRELPATTAVGDEVPVRLEVVAESRRARAPMRVEDHHPALEEAVVFCEPGAAGRASSGEHPRRALRRGIFSGGELHLVSEWPFGALCVRRTVDVASPIVVVPSAIALHGFPLAASGSGEDAPAAPPRGHGDEFAGVRDYRTGDDVRRVHWRSTARRGQLVVREDARAAAPRVAIVVAGADRGAPPESAFEALVTAAASIGLHALSRGHELDLVRPGPDGRAVHLHAADHSGMLTWLAAAGPSNAPLAPLVGAAVAAAAGGTLGLCLSSEGRAASELGGARTTIGRAGATPVVVAAAASTWGEGREGALVSGGEANIVSVADRVLRRDRSLGSCLEA